MDFWDKITGSDMNKEFNDFELRMQKLSEDYKVAWEEIKTSIWQYSDFSGRNLMPIFEGVVSMLEETWTDGKSVETVLGGDIKGFCLELTKEYDVESFRDKWRNQLNSNITKRLSK